MRIVVIGTVQFTLEMLQVIYQQNIELVGVVSRRNREYNSDYADLVPFCEHNKIAHYRTYDINAKESIEWIQSKSADLIFCLGWSQLIRSQLLNLTSHGVVGYHPSYLPNNRGRHPLVWALVLGLKETGSTFFLMDQGADSGDIISQEIIYISAEDDANSLYIKMTEMAKKQLVTIITNFKNGSCPRIQQDSRQANVWRKRYERDGEIDWRMSAESIYNLVRGLTTPYVGAHFIVAGEKYKVWKSCIVQRKNVDNLEFGKVIEVNDNELTIKCGDGCLKLIEVSPIPNLFVGDYL